MKILNLNKMVEIPYVKTSNKNFNFYAVNTNSCIK